MYLFDVIKLHLIFLGWHNFHWELPLTFTSLQLDFEPSYCSTVIIQRSRQIVDRLMEVAFNCNIKVCKQGHALCSVFRLSGQVAQILREFVEAITLQTKTLQTPLCVFH